MLWDTKKLTAAPVAAIIMVFKISAFVICISKARAVPVSVPEMVWLCCWFIGGN